jgi:D-glycero-D-manno-heptose 1,7-bisphosphate phosphatase
MNKAIFLDKDGTLIKNVPYNVDPSLIELENNTLKGLYDFQQNGYLLIVVSNQSGIAFGYFTRQELKRATERMQELLEDNSIKLDGVYYCPHHPEGKKKQYRKVCACRKPLPGLIKSAAIDFNIDLSQSWMIGDILHDVEAGNRAGCKTILINNGNETEWKVNSWRYPDYEVSNLDEAARFVLTHNKFVVL